MPDNADRAADARRALPKAEAVIVGMSRLPTLLAISVFAGGRWIVPLWLDGSSYRTVFVLASCDRLSLFLAAIASLKKRTLHYRTE